MAGDQQANKNPVEQPEAPMPSAQEAPTVTPSEVAAPQGEASTQEEGQQQLPPDSSQRTKDNFEKLRRDLREERARREYLEGVFNSMNQPKEQVAPLYDSETGLLNEQALTDVQRRALEAERRAREAEARVQGYLENLEIREVFAKHPEVDPSSDSFDENLDKMAAAIWTYAQKNPHLYDGEVSKEKAVALAKDMSRSAVERAKAQGAQEAVAALTPKEQAALEASGTGSNRVADTQEIDALRRKTRRGDLDSIVARMKRTG